VKFTVQADVDSEIVLSAPLRMVLNARTVDFGIDKDRRWITVTVTAQVLDHSKFKWGLEPVTPTLPNQGPVKIHARFDVSIYGQIREDLQNLESSVALMFPLRHIHWETPRLNVVFETPEEQNPPDWSPLMDFKPGRSRRAVVQPEDETFQSFALLSTRHSQIAVALSFWREGSNEFEEGQFINAFYNYYFVLEGLYAKGKFKSDAVLSEFRRNSELRESMEMFLKEGAPANHITQVTDMLTRRTFTKDPDGILKLIVHTRGDLHHFADNPNKTQPSPFNQHQFEGLSSIMRFVSRRALMSRMMRVNNSFPSGSLG
jgi:hypothetical protein